MPKAVTILLNSVLPPDLRDDNRTFDKKSIESLLAEVARRHPDQYAEVVKSISDIGRSAAYLQGSTLTLRDMVTPFDKEGVLAQMDQELAAAESGPGNSEERAQSKLGIWSRYAEELENLTLRESKAQGNNLAHTVISGARGNPFQLKAMVATPALYTDYKDRIIPRFVRRSFGEGLRPTDYLASAFGVRRSILSTKRSTAEAGDFSKQLSSISSSQVVTEDDCGTTNGLDFEPDDTDIIGRVLAKTTAGVAAGTPIDKRIALKLRRSKDRVLVRSPLTCQAKDGICSHCLGLLPEGKFAPLGYSAGITAANALGEPLAQGSLSAKHSGGGFSGKKKVYAGFKVISQLAQSPDTFPDRAAVAELKGAVDKVEPAPQGGNFITIGGVSHYALPDHDVTVKPGDEVEAGDQLSEGIVDPYDIIKHRGLGEGRKYYVDRLRQAYEESGAGRPARLNLELAARATLDHVRVDHPDGLGDYLPDDVASYNKLATRYSPPASTKLTALKSAPGQYLQSPVLHYTIGTQLTPKMLDHIGSTGTTHVQASPEAPPFAPEMIRLRATGHSGEDWMAKFISSYLGTNLEKDVGRARDTNTESNVSYVPRLAIGTNFGKDIKTTGKF